MAERMTFSHFSEYPFINFINTVKMERGEIKEQLHDKEDLTYWLELMVEHNQLITKQVEHIQSGPIGIRELQSFRDWCRSYFNGDFGKEEFSNRLSSNLEEVPLYFELHGEHLIPLPSSKGTDGLIALLSYEILNVMSEGTIDKVKACENEGCLALFVNKKGKRRWCSMDVCGNRAKAKKHYRKKTSV
ncbi:hypothetical protein N781_05070 [Pontibacillus halophilus JSM 076056 = DSM 19796]|uniref:Zinc finger CGNR domain-containing protein n=1 Tax=Pontibacillus halophilus JSM 076056 = DSM 19796 TaxID=1385510 RepID=A0A0A5GIW1_9BACI|nr:CGNR zinc finger domain-containing protein [Pontibacillus halophilus]KGX91163.1 hypothetical protein N781_05070 [Pontibacillus halophilus JSM 076056 = DSM 19796]